MHSARASLRWSPAAPPWRAAPAWAPPSAPRQPPGEADASLSAAASGGTQPDAPHGHACHPACAGNALLLLSPTAAGLSSDTALRSSAGPGHTGCTRRTGAGTRLAHTPHIAVLPRAPPARGPLLAPHLEVRYLPLTGPPTSHSQGAPPGGPSRCRWRAFRFSEARARGNFSVPQLAHNFSVSPGPPPTAPEPRAVLLISQALPSRSDDDGGDLEFPSSDDRKHALPEDHQQRPEAAPRAMSVHVTRLMPEGPHAGG